MRVLRKGAQEGREVGMRVRGKECSRGAASSTRLSFGLLQAQGLAPWCTGSRVRLCSLRP